MRILFTAPRFHTNQHPAVRALQRAGHEVRFFVVHRGVSETYEALEPTLLPFTRPYEAWRTLRGRERPFREIITFGMPSVRAFLRAFRDFAPDVVVVREPASAFALLAAGSARLTGRRVVLYSQTPVHQAADWRRDLARNALMRLFDARWISPVRGDAGRHPRPRPGLAYVPFVMEPAEPRARPGAHEGPLRILDVGKFVRRKEHLLLLEALRDLRHERPVHLTIVGERSLPEHDRVRAEIDAFVAAEGLQDRVRVAENLPYEAVQRAYGEHDLFVLPSRDEAVGVSVLEAMAHGLPVITSDSAGAQWYVRPGGNGFVFRSGDGAHLRATLAEALRDPAALARMGEESLRLVRTVHRPEAYVQALLRAAGVHERSSGEVPSTAP